MRRDPGRQGLVVTARTVHLAASLLLAVACEGSGSGTGSSHGATDPVVRGAEIVEEFGARCDRDDQYACYRLGLWLTKGASESNFIIPRDHAKAFPLTKRACELGKVESCRDLGRMYEHGSGTEPSAARALEAYLRVCDETSGPDDTCANVGRLYEEGRGGVTRQLAKAAMYYQRSCAGGATAGCARLGSFWRRGALGERHYRKALAAYRRVCPRPAYGRAGCAGLGAMYEHGQGVEKSISKAIEYYEGACRSADDRSACLAEERLRETHDLPRPAGSPRRAVE